jgi:flagellar biosynthesis protein FlhA
METGAPARPFIQRNGDIIVAVGVMAVVAMMVVPLPWYVVDVLLALNLGLSLVVLLVSMYTGSALEFSVFPTLLLVATLFRLALNVCCTRLILLEGYAGNMVSAFGQFVVGGNPIVGFIVFLILVTIQFVVITRGAERVAEVAARFTLDAMPGKQMSIDADLNSGLLDDAGARRRRREIEREADFYGAMDGASKFVKGDAVAALIVTAINLVGGFGVGMIQQNLSANDALSKYALLTIGQGILSQVPALVFSTAAGIMVTRSASDTGLGMDVLAQVVRQPRALRTAAGFMLLFALVPGLPKVPFLLLSAGLSLLARSLSRLEAHDGEVAARQKKESEMEEARKPQAVLRLTQVDPLEIELGSSLVGLADPAQGGGLLERVSIIRRQVASDMGLVIPPVRIRDNLFELAPRQYAIKLRGAKVAGGELYPSHFLCMGGPDGRRPLGGIEVREPVFGLVAWWIGAGEKTQAEVDGLVVVDPDSVLATHLAEVVREHGHETLTRQDVQQVLDLVKETNQAVVEELVPSLLSVGEVQKVMQNLLREGVPVKDSITILETLADHARQTKDTNLLTEIVRRKLGRLITQVSGLYGDDAGVITVDPEVESRIAETARDLSSQVDPETGRQVLESLCRQVESVRRSGKTPVLLCSSAIRPQMKRLAGRTIPRLHVVSYAEVDRSVVLEPRGMVRI